MRQKQNSELDRLLDEILTDANGDDEQLWAFRQALEDNVPVPCAGTIAGTPAEVTKFNYNGNTRRGLTTTFRRPDGSKHEVAAADVVLADRASQRFIEAYRQWMGVAPSAAKPVRARKSQPVDLAAPSGSIEAVILSLSARAARCKILSSGEVVTLRASRLWDLVPGDIATIQPAKQWTYGGNLYLSGSIESTRLDVNALRLTPLRLTLCGDWDPADEYWGDPGDPIAPWAKKIITRGRRPRFEMEQVLPGEDPSDPWSDPILESNEKKEAGDYSGAFDILMALCRADLRCLDAHSHLGNLSFDTRPKDAIRHYEVGVRIGELSLGEGFNGVLPWGMIDNRPFLRCLIGYGLCLWRLERFEESATVFDRMLWMNPSDNQGVRFLIDDVRNRRAWRPED